MRLHPIAAVIALAASPVFAQVPQPPAAVPDEESVTDQLDMAQGALAEMLGQDVHSGEGGAIIGEVIHLVGDDDVPTHAIIALEDGRWAAVELALLEQRRGDWYILVSDAELAAAPEEEEPDVDASDPEGALPQPPLPEETR